MNGSLPFTTQDQVASSTQIFSLSPGLYSLVVTENRFLDLQDRFVLPALQVTAAPFQGSGEVELLTSEKSPWLCRVGDAVAIRVSDRTAAIALTSLKPHHRPDASIAINLQRIDGGGAAPASNDRRLLASPPSGRQSGMLPSAPGGQRVLRCDVLVHAHGIGDLRVSDVSWAGTQGRGSWIEAVAITPLEEISRSEIEYKGLTATGVETPWIAGGELCGTRGQGLPLTGLAIRLMGSAAQNFDVSYDGTFVSGARGAKGQNGSPIKSDRIGDAIEAIRVVVTDKRRHESSDRIF